MACLRCGECCCRHQVRLDLGEAVEIAAAMGLTLDDFRSAYADIRWPGTSSLLVRHEGGGCIFLKASNGHSERLCTIHAFKPSSCRDWAPGPLRPECQSGLAGRGDPLHGSGANGPVENVRDLGGFIDSLARDRRT